MGIEMPRPNSVRHLNSRDFAALGLFDVAFVKPVTSDGEESFEIHTADGKLVADAPSWEAAVFLIAANEMQAARVH